MYSRYPLRLIFLAIFTYCACLIGIGLVLQHFGGYEPCPMCIMQRYAFVGCAAIALIAGLHNANGFMRRLYAFLIGATAVAGASVSIRQIILQRNPPAETVCGPDLAYLLNTFPVGEAFPMIFQGTGDCSKADPFLGLTIAEWALINFALVTLIALWQLMRRTPERRRFG